MIAEQFVGGAHGVYEARGLIELLINKMTGGWLPFPRFRHTSQKRARKTTREWRVLQPVMHRVKLDSTHRQQSSTTFFAAVSKEVSTIRGTTRQFLRRGVQVEEGPDWASGAQVQDPLRPPGQEPGPSGD